MTIVCLGWGSLIWNPDSLKVKGEWQSDGPSLPIEYARQSKDGRLTLVIVPGLPEVASLWIELDCSNLEQAIEALRVREGMPTGFNVGRWPSQKQYSSSGAIGAWAIAKGITGVVWTALPAKFRNQSSRVPTRAEAIEHFNSLSPDARLVAKNYVQRTPNQVRTQLRDAFEQELGWTAT